ncbi:MAG: metallopeptidase TldD-related protein [Planctomycetota bacterium]
MNLIQILTTAQAKGQIKRWFCAIIDQESLSIGLQNSQIGGVYNPPNKKRSQSAQLLLELEGQKVVRNSLSRSEIENEHILPKLLALAISEESPPYFPERKNLPVVKVFSPELRSQVEGKATPLVEMLKIIQHRVRPKVSLSGKAEARYTQIQVHHSEGWQLNTESTSTSVYAQVDGLWGFSTRSRMQLESNQIEERSLRLSESVEPLHQELKPPRAQIPIVFSDSFAGSLVQKYIFSNLSAHQVALGLSCFSTEKVKAQEKLFSSQLNLRFEGLRDYHIASFRLNTDGTVGQNLDLISEGKLMNTIADLKGASLLHCAPTPLPEPSGLVWQTKREEQWDHLEEDFLFIDSALGLHTQDATTGSFSLAVPNAALVSKGKIVGRCKGRIQGNFFEILTLPIVSFTSPMMDNQGLLLTEGVLFMSDL